MIRRVPIWYLGTHKLETFLSFEKSSLLELKQSFSQSTYLLVTIFAFQGVLFVESIPATLPQPLQLHVQIPLAASKNPSWRAFPKQKRLDDDYAAWEQAKRSLGFLKGHSSGLGGEPVGVERLRHVPPPKIWLPAMEFMDLSEIESS